MEYVEKYKALSLSISFINFDVWSQILNMSLKCYVGMKTSNLKIDCVSSNLTLHLTLSHFWNFLSGVLLNKTSPIIHEMPKKKFLIFTFIKMKELCTWEEIKLNWKEFSVLPNFKSHISTESEALIDDATRMNMHCIEIEIFLFPV